MNKHNLRLKRSLFLGKGKDNNNDSYVLAIRLLSYPVGYKALFIDATRLGITLAELQYRIYDTGTREGYYHD